MRNHLGIPLLAKAIPRMGRFTVEYGELLAIIEGCSIGSSLDDRIVIESDSLLVVNSLISNSEEISDLGSLSSVFRSSIDVSSISFSYVFRTSNSPAHLLAKAALVSNVPQAWARNIPHDVFQAIMLENNI